jgi:DNA polymerase elongation subunit (family B)
MGAILRFANPNVEIDMSIRLLCYRCVASTVATRAQALLAPTAELESRARSPLEGDTPGVPTSAGSSSAEDTPYRRQRRR